MSAAIQRPPGFERLRTFLRRTTPAAVLLHTELGDRQLQCKSGAWRELADTICSMRPVGVIECVDVKGALLKTFDAALLGEAREESPLQPTSALQSDLLLLSRLIADAYRHSNETAFGQVVRLCEIAFRRLDVIETGWTKMQRQALRQLERGRADDDGEGEGEGNMAEAVLENLAQGVIQGQLEQAMRGGKPAPAADTKPNGKGGKHGRS